MVFVLAAGLLVAIVALLVLRPLLRPETPAWPAESPASAPPEGAPAQRAADPESETTSTVDPLEIAIAERRARMSEREEDRG